MAERIVFGVAEVRLHLGASSRRNMSLRCSERTGEAGLCSALSYPILPFFLSQSSFDREITDDDWVRVGHSFLPHVPAVLYHMLEALYLCGTLAALSNATFVMIQDASAQPRRLL
jgi:hypothetical protein